MALVVTLQLKHYLPLIAISISILVIFCLNITILSSLWNILTEICHNSKAPSGTSMYLFNKHTLDRSSILGCQQISPFSTLGGRKFLIICPRFGFPSGSYKILYHCSSKIESWKKFSFSKVCVVFLQIACAFTHLEIEIYS